MDSQREGRHGGRLWTPWRMRYVGGDAKEIGCVFCNRLASADDTASLILHREPDAFVIMNLFPYNTGHLMIVPSTHLPSPEEASDATLARLGAMLRPVTRALRRVLGCDGFNVGFNVGSVAGAGIAEHLHQHVVPRWVGDANFMPILAETMVLPELIPATYAKVRAELRRELASPGASDRDTVRLMVASQDAVLLRRSDQDGVVLPPVIAPSDMALWRAGLSAIAPCVTNPILAGWGGSARTSDDSAMSPVLRISVSSIVGKPGEGWLLVPLQSAAEVLSLDSERGLLQTHLSDGSP